MREKRIRAHLRKQIPTDDNGPVFEELERIVWLFKDSRRVKFGEWKNATQVSPIGKYREMGLGRKKGKEIEGSAIVRVGKNYAIVKEEQFRVEKACFAKQNAKSDTAHDAPATVLTGKLLNLDDGRYYHILKWARGDQEQIRADKVTITDGGSRRLQNKKKTYDPGHASISGSNHPKLKVDGSKTLEYIYRKIRRTTFAIKIGKGGEEEYAEEQNFGAELDELYPFVPDYLGISDMVHSQLKQDNNNNKKERPKCSEPRCKTFAHTSTSRDGLYYCCLHGKPKKCVTKHCSNIRRRKGGLCNKCWKQSRYAK